MLLKAMMQPVKELLLFLLLAIFTKATGMRPPHSRSASDSQQSISFCLSWRLAVEANNVRAWRTVPTQCLRYIETYMIGGQYDRDVELIVEQILSYVNEIVVSDDGMDAWILDVDDTCISNVFYYRGKRYGCDPYDPSGFKAWALKGGCPSIPAMLVLFSKLVEGGFKIILVTGRDEATFGEVTRENLRNQGFSGYEKLIMRSESDRGKTAVAYKSGIRKQLMEEGYRIWGNVGDQWSDLQGEYVGNRTFKIPNPMYFVP
ncbi:acid phosphatase 1 [Pistacia vera]|uniref:acid phosphatase 1 n=1 Tax=Pistacia vera TaxID=55513 RepID=UPI001262DAED|nr:acid phosphatase 1 [Pistacia vera]XP_031247493.1 acid phosphatase 1 [Pistacia vera]XP_031247494.1 acid phosphatase 1 [Pistacia vera]XP_031247495.1 acid phosphatase 1 [Pistacia vera]